jgi:ketosteroid isomerase-like protein
VTRSRDAADVVADLHRLYTAEAGDLSALREVYHPDALLVTVTGGPDPLPVDRLLAQLEQASRDTWYSVTSWKTDVVDAHAVIVSGRMRRSVPGGGFEDAGHVWLLTVSGGLIYRQGVYGTVEQAAAAYEELGISLGIVAAALPEAAAEEEERVQPEPVRRWDAASGEV